MELLKLIIWGTCTYFYGYGISFNIIVFHLFLNLVYRANIQYSNNLDLYTIIIILINIMIHIIIYYFNEFIYRVNKTWIGYNIIYAYNFIDEKITKIKSIIINQIMGKTIRFIWNMSKTLLLDESVNETLQILKSKNIFGHINAPKIKLKTNSDINNFLDNLLLNNKTTN
jgi:hypothetical protein